MQPRGNDPANLLDLVVTRNEQKELQNIKYKQTKEQREELIERVQVEALQRLQ